MLSARRTVLSDDVLPNISLLVTVRPQQFVLFMKSVPAAAAGWRIVIRTTPHPHQRLGGFKYAVISPLDLGSIHLPLFYSRGPRDMVTLSTSTTFRISDEPSAVVRGPNDLRLCSMRLAPGSLPQASC